MLAEILLVIVFSAIVIMGALLLAPLWLGRMLLPAATFAGARRFAQTLSRLAALIKPDMDMEILVNVTNRYYAQAYARAPYARRAVFLPFCLKPSSCPAPVSRAEGLLCNSQCPGCALGRLRREALNLGYGWVYVVPSSRMLKKADLLPSSQFIKQKITRHHPQAALGVICAWHLRNRLLPSHNKVGSKGYVTSHKQKGAALRGILLKGKNCLNAQVDWRELRCALYWPAAPPQKST